MFDSSQIENQTRDGRVFYRTILDIQVLTMKLEYLSNLIVNRLKCPISMNNIV